MAVTARAQELPSAFIDHMSTLAFISDWSRGSTSVNTHRNS